MGRDAPNFLPRQRKPCSAILPRVPRQSCCQQPCRLFLGVSALLFDLGPDGRGLFHSVAHPPLEQLTAMIEEAPEPLLRRHHRSALPFYKTGQASWLVLPRRTLPRRSFVPTVDEIVVDIVKQGIGPQAPHEAPELEAPESSRAGRALDRDDVGWVVGELGALKPSVQGVPRQQPCVPALFSCSTASTLGKPGLSTSFVLSVAPPGHAHLPWRNKKMHLRGRRAGRNLTL